MSLSEVVRWQMSCELVDAFVSALSEETLNITAQPR